MKNTVLVVGTGTIGEPLIGLLADSKKKLGISEVMFHKRTPLKDEVAKVQSLIKCYLRYLPKMTRSFPCYIPFCPWLKPSTAKGMSI